MKTKTFIANQMIRLNLSPGYEEDLIKYKDFLHREFYRGGIDPVEVTHREDIIYKMLEELIEKQEMGLINRR